MPLYEYRCSKCGHQFEHLQKINSDDLVICPKCKAPNLQRLISHTSFQLKGSGWYVTDYKDKGKGGSIRKTSEKTVEGTRVTEENKESNDKPRDDKPKDKDTTDTKVGHSKTDE